MKLPYTVSVGLRYTRASKKSGMLSFLSSISMFGLILGIALLIVVLSVMNGFERELRERILALMPQASLFQAGGVEDWPDLQQQLLSYPEVTGASPFVRLNTLLSHRGNTEPALLYGVDLASERKISLLEAFVDSNAMRHFESQDAGVLLGAELALTLQINVGDDMMVIAPGSTQRAAAQIAYLPVLGLIDSNTELDQNLALAKLTALDTLRADGLKGKVDGMRLAFERLDDAPYIAMQIANDMGPTFYQTNWRRTHGNLYHAIQVSKNMVGLLMSLIVALAAFNIVSTLFLVVTEKQASIAILRTLGASPKAVLAIFMTQGLAIGTGGVAIGVIIGCAISLVLEPVLQTVERIFGLQFIHSDAYPLSEIPSQIVVSDVLMVVVISMILVFLATVFPAITAMRLQPAQVLRYE